MIKSYMPSRVGVSGGGNRKRVVNPVDIENKTNISATECVNNNNYLK